MAITFEADLEKMLPAFLREQPRLMDFIREVGKILDEIKAKIDGLADFQSVDDIDVTYIQHMADHLGYQLKRSGVGLTYTEAELRRLVKAIPTLYSLKGTVQGFEALLWYYYGVSIISVLELWTKDYAVFKPYLRYDEAATEDNGEYYISPHVLFTFPTSIFTTLGVLVGGGEQEGRAVFSEILSRMEDFRPAHAVFLWALEWTTTSVGTLRMAPLGLDSPVLGFVASRAWS